MATSTLLATGKNLKADATMHRRSHYCNDFLFSGEGHADIDCAEGVAHSGNAIIIQFYLKDLSTWIPTLVGSFQFPNCIRG
jgi:hypothetical protein